MKSTAIFFVIFAGSVFCSCSKAEITATPVSQTRAGDNEVSLLFTKDNLSESQAIEFATHFLKKTPFFYTWDVLHFLPRNYIQYNEPFEVWYSGFTIHFRGIDVGIAGPVTADRVKFGRYAGQVVRDVQIYSAGEKPEIGEVVYEERDGRKVPVGKRYQYDTNSEGSNCWILVQWESVRDFETCIGY